ncbi:hypothetical protein F5146DRAFT_1054453 [Armillaria mellea]|nr:hypothetical protein F5146DRAFT_1054453 [Armillaria mellea]
MGQRKWILCTFLGLLACSTAASITVSVIFFDFGTNAEYIIPTFIFEAIMFASAAYHIIKQSGGLRSLFTGPRPILRLIFQGICSLFHCVSIIPCYLYFCILSGKCFSVLGSLPFMGFVDSRLGITIMSVTTTRMLLCLRKNYLSDTPTAQKVELTTFRATVNREDVIDIRPYSQGS